MAKNCQFVANGWKIITVSIMFLLFSQSEEENGLFIFKERYAIV